MAVSILKTQFLFLVFAGTIAACIPARAQNPTESTPAEHKRADPQQPNEIPPLVDKQAQQHLTAAELSVKDTPGAAMLRTFEFEEYQFRCQLVLYLRLNGIVPPASRPKPPELKD